MPSVADALFVYDETKKDADRRTCCCKRQLIGPTNLNKQTAEEMREVLFAGIRTTSTFTFRREDR